MSPSPTAPHAAYIEDYNEDSKTTLPETRQTANITARRSKPDVVKLNGVHDEFSDSGYSSRTAATLGSGDSSLDSKTGAAPLKLDTSFAARKERLGVQQRESHKTGEGSRKPALRRTESKSNDRSSRLRGDCPCDECKPQGSQSARSPEKARSSRDVAAKTISKAQPQVAPPPRPQSTKPLPSKPVQDDSVQQSAQARPRPATAQSHRKPRPMSFHGGSLPQVTYQPVYVAQVQPPMATPSPFPPPSYPPPSHSYFPPAPPVHQPYPYSIPPSPIEGRPPLSRWMSGQQPAQRQSFVYNTSPVIEHVQQPQYPTTVLPQPVVRRTSIPRGYPYPPREENYIHDEDYYRMPPPPPPPKQQVQRPSIRHAATTSIAHAALYPRRNTRTDVVQETHTVLRSPAEATTSPREASQRPAMATRPSNSSSNNSSSSTHVIERDMRRLSVESNGGALRPSRPVSYYGHESARDLERSVEAYQASSGSSTSNPLTVDTLNLVRKKTHTSSDAGSRLSAQSKGSKKSNETKPRTSTDRREGSDVKSRNDTDGITMRFNASQAVSVDVKGSSVEGRTISLRPSKDGGDGDMVFSIGGKSGATSSRASLKEKSRRRYSYVESTGVRELEPAGSAGRLTRESRTRESSRAPEKRVAVSRSRRSSKNGRN